MAKINCAALIAVLLAPGALAAERQDSTSAIVDAQQQTQRATAVQSGPVAQTPGDKQGRRLTREETSPLSSSLTRIDSRIQNRVQSRINMRLDHGLVANLDPAAAFKAAEANARRGNRHQ
jgi:hypothetical protein